MPAHAESGPVDLGALLVIGVVILAAAAWLVVVNRRLDAKENPVDDELATDATGRPDGAPRWALVLVTVLVVALVGGGGFAVYRAQSNLADAEAQAVVDDLCLAAEQSSTDPEAALATFNASPHNALHGLDTDLRRVDPLAASSLATAKAEAEAALIAGTADAPELTRTLAEETAAAYRILEDDTIRACG